MILFKYLSRQIIGSTIALTLVLLSVILSGRFIKYLTSVATGDMAANILSQVMLYRLPGFLELILPLGFFLSILLVYGRMYIESEMIVLFASGFSRNKLLGYTLLIALLMALLVSFVSCVLVPIGSKKFNQIWDDPNNFRGLNTLIEGVFQDNKGTNWITYTDELSPDKRVLGLVFMAQVASAEQQQETLIIAKSGRVLEKNKDHYIELHDGFRYKGNPGELNYQMTQFEQYGQKVNTPQQRSMKIFKPESQPTLKLLRSQLPQDLAVVHWRFGVPISLLIMSLFAFAMSKTDHRRGRFIKVLPAVIIYVLYIFLMSAGKNYLSQEKLPLWLGLWWLHAIFFVLALFAYFIMSGWRPRLLSFAKAKAA